MCILTNHCKTVIIRKNSLIIKIYTNAPFEHVKKMYSAFLTIFIRNVCDWKYGWHTYINGRHEMLLQFSNVVNVRLINDMKIFYQWFHELVVKNREIWK